MNCFSLQHHGAEVRHRAKRTLIIFPGDVSSKVFCPFKRYLYNRTEDRFLDCTFIRLSTPCNY